MFNPRDEMSLFVMSVSDDLVEEWWAEMLHENMDLSRLIVYSQQVKECSLYRNYRDAKRASPYDGGSSKGEFEIQDKPMFMKRFYIKVPSKISKGNKDRVTNCNIHRLKVSGSSSETTNCSNSGKRPLVKHLWF